ncbi:hypothetical protein CASFOL_021263 [Castilleja foliolosa]|uniref:DNA repair protein Rad4 n=1 Tax=Castilleja foliolosa TaxID=1961234 RepID=A0ABD3CYK8_9LAMI
MRTRSRSKRPETGVGEEANDGHHVSESIEDNEALSNISRNAVGKLLKRAKKGFNKEDHGYLRQCEALPKITIGTAGGEDREAMENASNPDPEKRDVDNDYDDSEWEDGSIPTLSSIKDFQEDSVGVSVEFDVSHGVAKKKLVRRATAEEREVAELMHKAHLLCLLGRGRLIDSACNDHLIQASILSLVPEHLLKIAEFSNLTANNLSPLVSWFHKTFHVRSSSVDEKSCHSALASTLETQEGTSEAVAALSVALFRALNLTTRFVSILDVVSLKPDADKSESSVSDGLKSDIFSSSTLMVAGPSCSSAYTVKPSPDFAVKGAGRQSSDRSRKHEAKSRTILNTDKSIDKTPEVSVPEVPADTKSEGLKRKGDLEFQMQCEMALAATAFGNSDINMSSNASESPTTSTLTPPSKRLKRIRKEEYVSTAIGSKKVGAPLYWAEVFCSGENSTGKWVHVDAVNAIIDGDHKVEAAAAACKKSLRYVVAFAGNGAKDVTRRYCTKWYRVANQRINSTWWVAVLDPLKELESGATGGGVNVEFDASLEDMELETKALTEPLPTNQQAYRNHHLYVIERWLKKYEILYPKGPVLGFCSGHPVYPRTCVQPLHTKERWLREGLQVKADEVPVKVLNRSTKSNTKDDNDYTEEDQDHQGNTSLYGKWQTEPLCLPHAENGIVPKNERGQVDVWSEKCLPVGTIHLPFPRVALVAKRLNLDYAPAMVGFEHRNGRSFPLFKGIVVCAEFKNAILEAYLEEEERREAEEKRKNEAEAVSRWYQLLSSIITRQRLNECYGGGDGVSLQSSKETPRSDDKRGNSAVTATLTTEACQNMKTKPEEHDAPEAENHQHEYIFDENALIKRCHCGFSIQFEEL